MKGKVIFIGAGPGDPDLITVKGRKAIEEADVIIYAGSLVNKDVLSPARDDCVIHNSAYLNLEETDGIITEAVNEGPAVTTSSTATSTATRKMSAQRASGRTTSPSVPSL